MILGNIFSDYKMFCHQKMTFAISLLFMELTLHYVASESEPL